MVKAVKVERKEIVKRQAIGSAPNPYSVKGMKKVMDGAKGVEGLLKNRHESQQKMLKNM